MVKLNAVIKAADDKLASTLSFPNIANGYLVNIVNETIGDKSGGGTNPFGTVITVVMIYLIITISF